jgi:hypothetical protein
MTTVRRSFAATLPPVSAFQMHRAVTGEDWRRIALLRYKALRGRGDIAESATEAFGDWHDRAFNCQAFLLTHNGRPAGTTRSSVSSASRRWPLPAMECFSKEIAEAVGGDLTILEASLTAVDAAVVEPRAALFHLFKAHMLRCAAEGADWLIVAVPDTQIGFYRRMFNMRILSGPEQCPGLELPRVLMGLEFREHAALLAKRMPALATTPEEEQEFTAAGKVAFAAEPVT